MASTKEGHYLLCPSTINVANFVPTKLWFSESNSNYETWREQMLCLLRSQKLDHLVVGRTQPPQTNNPEDVTNQLVRGWILGSINDNIITSDLLKLETSKEVWLELKSKSRKLSSPVVQPLHQGANLKQKDSNIYSPLYKAIIEEDWKEFARAIKDDHQIDSLGLWARNDTIMTALQVAIGTGKSKHIIEELVELIDDDELESLFDNFGTTILGMVAAMGNEQAAAIIVKKVPSLLDIPNNFGKFPTHIAAQFSHKGVLEYLLSQSEPHSYESEDALQLFVYMIDAEFLDVALKLVVQNPNLATLKLQDGTSALKKVVGKKSVFFSPRHFNLWQRFIYCCIQLPGEKEMGPHFSMSSSDHDIESMASDDVRPRGAFQNLHAILWRYMKRLVPQIWLFKKKLSVNQTAMELVKCLCEKMESMKYPDAAAIYFDAIVTAAELEIHEVIDVIIVSYPAIIYRSTPANQFIFQMAVQSRSIYVFKLISEFQTVQKHLYSDVRDSDGNNLLHLAAKLSPSEKLNEIAGAALQMQHELQWYKIVESFVHPYCGDQPNNARKTPKMVFAEEHQELKKDGRKWMKETAVSYTVAAALIATLMFAAAITVPGGNEGNTGFPLFSNDTAFIIFAFSDALSLFTSTISLLIFLSILILPYGIDDFSHILPIRLIAGLGFLFLSIAFMMAAYTATVYLTFGQKKAWILIPAATFASTPVISFVLLQSSLFSDLFLSQFGHGVFDKKRYHHHLH